MLFRRDGRRHGDVTEFGVGLLRVESADGARPVLRRELEVPLAGPVGHDADDVAEVGLRLQPVCQRVRSWRPISRG